MRTKNFKTVNDVLSKLNKIQHEFMELKDDRINLTKVRKTTKDPDEKDYLIEAEEYLDNLEDALMDAISSLESIEEDDD